MTGWQNDLRMSMRAFARAPLLSGVIIATLAGGIGMTAAMYSIVDAVLVRNLPLPDAHELVRFSQDRPAGTQRNWGYSYAMYRALSRQMSSARLAGYSGVQLNVTTSGVAERVSGVRVTDTFFAVTGLPLALGRSFSREEEASGLNLVVISHEFWRDALGADPQVVGRAINLGAAPYEVIGVTGPGAHLIQQINQRTGAPADRLDLYVPLEPFGAQQADLTSTIQLVGRLQGGATVSQARDEAFGVLDAFLTERGSTGWQTRAVGLQEYVIGTSRLPLLVLFGAVGVLLVMVCANLGGLVLVRGVGRSPEWLTRSLLGANRRRIARQILMENGVLAVAGGVLGLVFAGWIIAFVRANAPAALPRAGEIALDGRAAAFALALVVATTLLFGLLPAAVAARQSVGSLLSRSRQTMGVSARRALKGLVAVQVAMALVLLTGSGVLMRSLNALLAQDPGFSAAGVIQTAVDLPIEKYAADTDVARFTDAVREQLTALPGAEMVVVSSITLPTQSPQIRFQKADVAGADGAGSARQSGVSPDYFSALDIRIVEGRGFTEADHAGAPGVAIVTRALAERYWPGETAVGRRVLIGSWRTFRATGMSTPPVEREIVGVTENLSAMGIDPGPPVEMLFAPFAQDPWGLHAYLVKATGPAAQVTGAIRRAVAAVDAQQPVFLVGPMLADQLADISRERTSTAVLGTFAIVALIISSLGIYGVVAYSVVLRRREIGVRVALGAGARSVSRLVARESLLPVTIGLAGGLLAALMAVRLLRGLLFEVSPFDPVAFAGAAVTLAALALVAAVVPARRTSRVDPWSALRPE